MKWKETYRHNLKRNMASRRVNIETKKKQKHKRNIKPTVDKTKKKRIDTAKYPLNIKRPLLIFNEKIGRFFH
jgi:hypothetical protein